jgi:sodium-dependent dicarboxylate transporter 2/3/5
VLGAVVFLALLFLPAPEGLGADAWRTTAVATLMAIWWMTEAIPIPATALLPLGLFPLLGVLSPARASEPYANEVIFLFMGGFLLAVTMEKWGLHKRIALRIMTAVGTSPSRLVLGFMLATAFLSMWISNTATAAMMLPIAIAVGEMFRPPDTERPYDFGIALMLGVAYASSIGGVATLIGTPPNAVLAGAASELLGREIGFLQWMGVGLPIAAVVLPASWLLLTRVLFPAGPLSGDAAAILDRERAQLGTPSRGEKITAVVFGLAALAWIFRTEKTWGEVTIPGLATLAPGLADSTIAMIAAASLFFIPVDWRRGEFVLDWKTARNIPWEVLVLFGGGLSLARAMEESGLAASIGGVVGGLGAVSPLVVLVAVTTLIVFLTEVTSNTATATMAMPVMAGVASGLATDPLLLMTAAALGASMAFMLPVATPPNAIVFASGYLTIPRMVRAGFWLNWISIVTITFLGYALIPVFLE